MSRSSALRPVAAAMATAVLGVATLTGCGTATVTPSAISSLNQVTPAPAPASPSPSTTPVVSASYPKTPGGYASTALIAWVDGREARLSELTDGATRADFDAVPGGIDKHWHFNTCDGTAGTTYCVFDNNNGDRIRLGVLDSLLGKAHGVAEMMFDTTAYGMDADTNVNAFLRAWVDGNTRRMVALSNSTVTKYFTHYTPPETWTLSDNGTAGHVHVSITNSGGFSAEVDVIAALLGGPHAIAAVCAPDCA